MPTPSSAQQSLLRDAGQSPLSFAAPHAGSGSAERTLDDTANDAARRAMSRACRCAGRAGRGLLLSAILGALGGAGLFADVSTPMFQCRMVLQREMAAPVFGKASPGEAVTVTFRGQTKTTRADDQGKWLVKLDPMDAGGPFEMTVAGANTLRFDNVMVGEVWLCAGQSNMGYSMKKLGARNVAEAAGARQPDIRIQTMMRGQITKWEPLTPEVCLKSSATAYYFGKELHAALDVPIGLIVSSSPGTAIRYWADPETIAADPKLAGEKSVGKWYNELVKPVIPYGIRGAIWYQGESDTDGNASEYQARFQSLLRNYRKIWGQGDFPFLYVQLANFGPRQTDAGAPSRWAEVRAAQTATLALPNTAMAVTIDIGDPDYHPENKWDVGKRLALPALRLVYDHQDVSEYSGPTLRSCEKKDGQVFLRFDHAPGGLVNQDGGDTLAGFAVSGADGQWHWAKGVIQNDAVVLTCAEVQDPVNVRYAWADCPIATPLYNQAGLPAGPFEAVPVIAAKKSEVGQKEAGQTYRSRR